MLVKMHPDVTKLVWKFNRYHHYVDYRPFKNLGLIRKKNLDLPSDNLYKMKKVIRPKVEKI
jgi:hypothetical protein